MACQLLIHPQEKAFSNLTIFALFVFLHPILKLMTLRNSLSLCPHSPPRNLPFPPAKLPQFAAAGSPSGKESAEEAMTVMGDLCWELRRVFWQRFFHVFFGKFS